MAKNLLDVVGDVATYHAFEDGKNYIQSVQHDVEPLMDFAHAMREETAHGKDEYCAARLPLTIVEELMRKHGINLLQKLELKDERRLMQLLETEYARFKFTNKKMFIPT